MNDRDSEPQDTRAAEPDITGGTSPDLLGDTQDTTSGMSAPRDRPEPELSGAEIREANSREGGREDPQVPVPNRDGTTDQYVARGSGDVGGTTEDRSLRSGAGAQAGSWDDRNANSGAAGNVSAPDGLPGQGEDHD